jgi:hypothetical protein
MLDLILAKVEKKVEKKVENTLYNNQPAIWLARLVECNAEISDKFIMPNHLPLNTKISANYSDCKECSRFTGRQCLCAVVHFETSLSTFRPLRWTL